MKHNTALLVVIALVSFLPMPSATQVPRFKDRPDFDARRLKTGTFVYRDREGSKDLGRSQISIEEIPSSGNFRFSNVVTGKFSQRWVAVTSSTLDPVSASLSFGEGDGSPAFDLTYSSGRVRGFVVDRKGPTAGTSRSVNAVVPADIVDQRVDWAAVSASGLQPNREFEFDVYDPSLGISHVLARVGQVQSIRVPVGEFETYPVTYRIEKRTGNETYKVFVSKDEPRMLIREEFPDGAVTDLSRRPD
jgi:hypothetical protein